MVAPVLFPVRYGQIRPTSLKNSLTQHQGLDVEADLFARSHDHVVLQQTIWCVS